MWLRIVIRQLDSTPLHSTALHSSTLPYILKGRAFTALGRANDALLVWEKGYQNALSHSTDLKHLLEIEELLKNARQGNNGVSQGNHVPLDPGLKAQINGKPSDEQSKKSLASDLPSKPRELSQACSSELGLNMENGISADAAQIQHEPTTVNENSVDAQDCSKEKDVSSVSSNLEDVSNTHAKPGGSIVLSNGSSDKANGKKKSDGQTKVSSDKPSKGSGSNYNLSDKLSIICSSLSDDAIENYSQLGSKVDIHIDTTSDEVKKSKKFCVARVSKTKSISVDFGFSRGVAQVNDGKYATAISSFDQILIRRHALIGRGTAYAFLRELEPAIADFTKAIESNPSTVQAWKRRGQARAALGHSIKALEDLTKALEFEPDSADGLALSSIGEYKRAEEAHLKSIQIDRGFVEAWAHLTQFYQDLANTTKALECIQQVLQLDNRFAKAYYLRGLLLHGMGEHMKAIKDLTNGLSIEKSNIECLYLRGSCYHAVGEYGEAIKDYDATLDLELDSVEKFVIRCMAFYQQKEIALYTASKVKSEFCWFDIDRDIDPVFKEYWCKRLHPKNVCEKVFRQPPLNESLKRGKLRKLDFSVTKQKTALLKAADSIGQRIQYDCPGFLPNRRQHRMAGLAAIQIAQKVSRVWRTLQTGWRPSNKNTTKSGKRAHMKDRINSLSHNRGGSGCSTSSYSETSTSHSMIDDKSFGCPLMTWQDIYSIAVKWRQISEPCDPVVWVNKLSEEFNSGFGSHTPMILGQAKVVRYFPNYERTLDVAKSVIKEKQYVYNSRDDAIDLSTDGKLQSVMKVRNYVDLYEAVGQDFYATTWCNSTSCEGKRLEGTRITLVKMSKSGYDFAIRTPCTPSRWDEFDSEMTAAWEALCNARNLWASVCNFSSLMLIKHNYFTGTILCHFQEALLLFVGFIVRLGLLLAANMKFTGKIPQGTLGSYTEYRSKFFYRLDHIHRSRSQHRGKIIQTWNQHWRQLGLLSLYCRCSE
ncbi:hypothetical protein ACFE04_023553 [Oxalis oulophora]